MLIPVLFMLWFALFLTNLSLRSKIATGVLFALYLSLFFPAWKSVYQRHKLILHPDRIAEYILSEHEEMRYIALLTFPDEFTPGELNRFARDISPRIRLRAIHEAGMRKDARYLDIVEEACLILSSTSGHGRAGRSATCHPIRRASSSNSPFSTTVMVCKGLRLPGPGQDTAHGKVVRTDRSGGLQ